VKVDGDKDYNYFCYRLEDGDSCEKTDHPLEFVEVEPDVYKMDGIESDAQLISRV
jgi:hypothetical protein